LQTLDCSDNRLTSLEPLHSLRSLELLHYSSNSSLSQAEIGRFQKAVPSCEALSLDLDMGMEEEPI